MRLNKAMWAKPIANNNMVQSLKDDLESQKQKYLSQEDYFE
jgi:hypothetical protein